MPEKIIRLFFGTNFRTYLLIVRQSITRAYWIECSKSFQQDKVREERLYVFVVFGALNLIEKASRN